MLVIKLGFRVEFMVRSCSDTAGIAGPGFRRYGRPMKATKKKRYRSTVKSARRSRPGPLPERANELMAAALKLFSEQDFSAVTIKDIGQSVGVNTALIYYYFDDKADLFRASLQFSVDEALSNYRRLRERHSDPVDLITDWLENHIELVTPIRQLVKIMLDYSTSLSRKRMVDEAIKHFYDEECRILSEAVQRGIELKVFKSSVDPQRAAHIASTYLDGIMVRSLIHKELDIRASVLELKSLLWDHLGYQQPVSATQSPADQDRFSLLPVRRAAGQ